MSLVVDVRRRLFTVEEYYRMVEAGILREDDRVELIEGEIIEMPPIGSHHGGLVKRLNQAFQTILGERAVLSIQDALRLSETSEPVPDLMLLRPRADTYLDSNPTPADVLLLVEVSDTTLAYDRQIKLPLYAGAAVPEVWIVDANAATVEVYRMPDPGGSYRERREFRAGDQLTVAAFPGMSISATELLRGL